MSESAFPAGPAEVRSCLSDDIDAIAPRAWFYPRLIRSIHREALTVARSGEGRDATIDPFRARRPDPWGSDGAARASTSMFGIHVCHYLY